MFDDIIKQVSTRFNLNEKAEPAIKMLVAYMTHNASGGLAGFVHQFKIQGLGPIVNSWLGGGTSIAQGILPKQVEAVLGGKNSLLEAMKSRLQLDTSTASSVVAAALPMVMAKLTPDGRMSNLVPFGIGEFVGDARGWIASTVGASGALAATEPEKRKFPMMWLLLGSALAAVLLSIYFSKQKTEVKAIELPATSAQAQPNSTVAALADAAKAGAGAVADTAKAGANAVVDTAKAAADAIPVGAAALATMFNGAPALKVYFEASKAELSPDFAEQAATIVSYIKANASAKLVISGFSDPTGSVAANEEMSKKRAKAVAEAFVKAGVPESSIVLEKPAVVTGSGDTFAESRRVEVIVRP